MTKSSGHDALALLRQRQEEGFDQFDLVLSDVYMPDMDGFKLLEAIGLELDLPVIMMSSNGDTNVVLRGVTHGAVDFLIKPVRIEELRNVWQHVVRRRSIHMSRAGEDSAVEYDGDSRTHGTKRKESETLHAEHEGGSGSKKPRVVWSVEMHQQFVNAVNVLGIDKAVPKRILDLMNVEGLTRENVASHLQKYRLYLKRVEGVQGGKNGRIPKPPAVERAAAMTLGIDSMEGSMGCGPVEGHAHGQPHAHAHGHNSGASSMPPHPLQSPQGPLQLAPTSSVVHHPPPHHTVVMAHAHMAAWQQQTMAMQAAAAAAAASGALPGSINPAVPPPYHHMSVPPVLPPGYPPAAGTHGGHSHAMPQSGGVHHYSHPGPPSGGGFLDPVGPRMPPVSSVPSFTSHGSLASSHQYQTQLGINGNENGNGIVRGHAQASNGLPMPAVLPLPNGRANGTSSLGHPFSSRGQIRDAGYGPPDDALLPSLGGGDGLGDVQLGDALLAELPGAKHDNDHDNDHDFLGLLIQGMAAGAVDATSDH